MSFNYKAIQKIQSYSEEQSIHRRLLEKNIKIQKNVKSVIGIIFLVGYLISNSANAQSLPVYVPENGLIGMWEFKDGSVDANNHSLETALYGAQSTSDRFGKNDEAYLFDPSNAKFQERGQEILVSYDEQLNTSRLSLFVWVLPIAYYWPGNSDHRSSIIARWGGGGDGKESFYLDVNNEGKIAIGLKDGQKVTEDISSVLPLNQWSHVGFTYDGETLKHYLNGSLVKTSKLGVSINNSTSPMSIGDHNQLNGHWYYWTGKIDDVIYYNRMLNTKEISSIYSKEGNFASNTNSQERGRAISRDGDCNVITGNFSERTFDWTGACEGGMAMGKGTLTMYEGSKLLYTFYGTINKGEVAYGKLKSANNEIDSFAYINGKRNGKGWMVYADDSKYIGTFKDNIIEGQGTYTDKSGYKYVGEWKNGKKHGQAIEYFSNGCRFTGIYSDGERQTGKESLTDGTTYIGNYTNGPSFWNGKVLNKQGKIIKEYINGHTQTENLAIAEKQKEALLYQKYNQLFAKAWDESKGLWSGKTNGIKIVKSEVAYMENRSEYEKKVCFSVTFKDNFWGVENRDYFSLIIDSWDRYSNFNRGCDEQKAIYSMNTHSSTSSQNDYKEYPWKDGAQIGYNFDNRKRKVECLKNHDTEEIYYNKKDGKYEVFTFGNVHDFNEYRDALEYILKRMNCK